MCMLIASREQVVGSAKGALGWFDLDHVYVGYDHPVHVGRDHALLLDFVSEALGPQARVAVELDTSAARDLASMILEALDQADDHENSP